jgi:outer membrane protein assembly factor BamB
MTFTLPRSALAAALVAALAQAQPTEKLTVSAGFRDWGPATLSGSTILAGSPTGRGGLYAVDTSTGKVKWSLVPTFGSGTASVSTPPAVSADIVVVPFAAAYPGATIAASLATGKELWRGPDPYQGAAVAINNGLAFILGKDGTFSALDIKTGAVKWKAAFKAGCASQPIVRDDIIYLTALTGTGNALLALDSATGAERWRYRAEAPYVHQGVCLRQPVITADTIYGAGEGRIYAINRATGRDRWPGVELKRELYGLVATGSVVIGVTSTALMAIDQSTGKTAWEIPGTYTESSPATAVAGNVLYFGGNPRGALHALDLTTRKILWSFTRPTAEANWSFGHVTTFEGGLWVDSYRALVKLQ